MKKITILISIVILLIMVGCVANLEDHDMYETIATIEEGLVDPQIGESVSNDMYDTQKENDTQYPLESKYTSQELCSLYNDDYSEQEILTWKKEPTLDYERISLCSLCGFFVVSTGFPLIDGESGEIVGELSGHGVDETQLLYDGVLGMFGVHRFNESFQELSFHTPEEFLLIFPYFENNLNLIHDIDSVKIIYEAYANHVWVLCEAFTGKVALAHGTDFVTGFYFEDGEWNDWRNGQRWYHTSVAVRQGDNWGIIDINGNIVAPFIFEHAITIDSYTAFVKYNGLYGILYI